MTYDKVPAIRVPPGIKQTRRQAGGGGKEATCRKRQSAAVSTVALSCV
jgi:hypothetical protein